MTRIKKKVLINGIETEITIDTGADISYMSKDQANRFNLNETGETTTLTYADGRREQAKISKGNVTIPKTCCEKDTKFAIVDNEQSNNEILLGNDYIESTGMKIDKKMKDKYIIECTCGEAIEKMKKRLEDIENTR